MCYAYLGCHSHKNSKTVYESARPLTAVWKNGIKNIEQIEEVKKLISNKAKFS